MTKAEVLGFGQTIDVNEVPVTFTGSGANVSVALARLGLKVGLITAVGRDALGDDILRELSKEGVDTSLVARVSLVETGLSVTVLRSSRASPPLVFRHRGAVDLLEVTEEVQKMLHTTQWLYLTEFSNAWEPAVSALLETLAGESTSLAWHPETPFLGFSSFAEKRELVSALLARCRVLFVNESEAEALSAGDGHASRGPAVPASVHGDLERALRSRGADMVVLTLGEEGAHARAENLHVSARPPSTAVLDARGAGDAFRAGFLAGFFHSAEDPAVALSWGLMNAASVVGSYTTQQGLLARSVLEERLRKNRIVVDQAKET